MHEFAGLFQFGPGLEAGFDPVFDGLDVVVGGLLDLLDGLAIGFGEVFHQIEQIGASAGRQWREFLEAGIAQGDEPGHFDLDAPVHVALFAHQRAQGGELGGVTPVQRGQGRNRGESHARIVV